MIVIYEDNGGRLCNKLNLFSHFIAFSIEHNISVFYPDFNVYSHYFMNTKKGHNIFTPKDNILLKNTYPIIYKLVCDLKKSNICLNNLSIIKYLIAEMKKDFFDLSDIRNVLKLKSSFIIFTKGYFFRYYDGVKKYSNIISNFFRPSIEYCKTTENIIKSINRKSYIVVGVHIRQTDYATWQGGKHYFSIEQYKTVMNKVKLIFNNKKNILYLISSDADLNPNDFIGFEFLLIKEDPIVCLNVLSQCDYLIGPKSSFNRWASFYGKVPLYTIYDTEKNINLNEFHVNYLDDSNAILNEPD